MCDESKWYNNENGKKPNENSCIVCACSFFRFSYHFHSCIRRFALACITNGITDQQEFFLKQKPTNPLECERIGQANKKYPTSDNKLERKEKVSNECKLYVTHNRVNVKQTSIFGWLQIKCNRSSTTTNCCCW